MFSGLCISLLAILSVTIPSVQAHAKITSPPIRSPGQDFLSTCGQPSFDSVTGDPTGHIEEQEPVSAGCDLTLCRGMTFKDQPAGNVQQVTPGQAMAMGVDCTVPHGGPANVSLVDTTAGGSGAFIGSFLKTFDDFCPTSGQTPTDQTNLQFTLPDSSVVGDKCQNAGDCVVQLFWATPDFSQNYYYCVDVQMGAASASSSISAITTSAGATSSLLPTITSSFSDITTSPTSTSSTNSTSSPTNVSSSAVASSLITSVTATPTSPPVVIATSSVDDDSIDDASSSVSLFMITVTTTGTIIAQQAEPTSNITLSNVGGNISGGSRRIARPFLFGWFF